MSLQDGISDVKKYVNMSRGRLEVWLHGITSKHSIVVSVLIKMLLIVLCIFIALCPLLFGVGLYYLLLYLASLFGIAVLTTKIVIFILLLISLGQIQLVVGIFGVTAAVLIILA